MITLENLRIGFALCGSYCTYSSVLKVLEELCNKCPEITPIMSENSFSTDTRFGKASEFSPEIEKICGKKIISTIADAEPIGPRGLFDILVIAPATGNTIAKIASGITDTCVTMAAKAQLRNQKPLLIAVSTNDGLSGNAANIGTLLSRKYIYLVPFYQDDPQKKPNSLVADFGMIPEAIIAAAAGKQLQPLLLQK